MGKRKPIPGFENYSADTDGNIYGPRGGKLKGALAAVGYLKHALWRNGKDHQKYAHHLVLETFVGPKPEKMQALHWDGVRTNNRLSNLRWGTGSENTQDAIRHGTCTIGHKNARAKLTIMQVKNIENHLIQAKL